MKTLIQTLKMSNKKISENLTCVLLKRDGRNVARQSIQTGPQSPNLHRFGLIFGVNTI